MRVLRAGDAALLVEAGDLASAHRLNAALRDAPPAGVVDVVPGEQTVLVITEPGTDMDRLAGVLPGLRPPDDAVGGAEPMEIPVVYDGADLDEVAELTGLSRDEVVRRHSDARYTVAYLGFSPVSAI